MKEEEILMIGKEIQTKISNLTENIYIYLKKDVTEFAKIEIEKIIIFLEKEDVEKIIKKNKRSIFFKKDEEELIDELEERFEFVNRRLGNLKRENYKIKIDNSAVKKLLDEAIESKKNLEKQIKKIEKEKNNLKEEMYITRRKSLEVSNGIIVQNILQIESYLKENEKMLHLIEEIRENYVPLIKNEIIAAIKNQKITSENEKNELILKIKKNMKKR